MTYTQALDFIHSTCWKGSRPGLERTIELAARLGNPQNSLKFIHVAGTNGKGSTSAMLAAILQRAGYRVGLYTSPFIIRFNERMQINGLDISDEELAEAIRYCHLRGVKTYITVNTLVTDRELEKAKELILEKLPIEQISEICGFESSAYFRRLFKKHVGTSPREYRRSHLDM